MHGYSEEFSDEPNQEACNDAKKYHGNDWKIEPEILSFDPDVSRQSTDPIQFIVKEINDDTNDDDHSANTNDPFASFIIHGLKNYQEPISKNQINLKIKKCQRSGRSLFGSCFLIFGSFLRKDSQCQDYK